MKLEQIQRIMIVDDNATDRFIHKKLLSIYKIGNSVIEFSSGRGALEFFRENVSNEEKLPDLILLDVLMPEMGGFDFLFHLESLEQDLAKAPVVYMLSSTDDESDLRQSRNIKMVKRLLRKPFSPEALIKAISEL
jgi:CheY-like chemotaxis protein